ncbi:MAG: ribbon-helix-helix protein, CopG family [Hyphomicrobiaceae bacterium]|nr:MAG: ribbon-helix-helix protein, CopG family [Hyphomicrobiaceae bacterium]
MRTTIRLDDDLLEEAKRHALETKRTLTDLIRDALVATLERERSRSSPRRVKLKTFKGKGLHEGVNLDSTADLLDRMDRSD